MKNLKTFEAFSIIPKYFRKENIELRNKKNIIKDKLTKLMYAGFLSVDNNVYSSGSSVVTPIYKPNKITKTTNKNGKIGNTFIKSHYGSGYFEINDDLTIDVFGSVTICNTRDHNLFDGIKFNIIAGNFNALYVYDIFDFYPEIVYDEVVIKDCGLNSFKDLPIKIIYGDKLNFSNNNLTSFEGIPEILGKDCSLDISSNDISTLDFLPKNIGEIEFYLNPISNIKLDEKDFDGDGYCNTLLDYLFYDIRSNGGNDYNLFLEYDPIHPPDDSSGKQRNGLGKSIIYLSKLNDFLDEVGFKPLSVTAQIKQYYTIIEW
jgi:hypothetical protein